MTKSKKLREKLAQRKEAVLLLRFRTPNPSTNPRKFCSYQRIATVVRLTYNQVQHICKKALSKTSCKRKNLSRQLDQAHVDFLTNERTLELWAGKTLKERTALFRRRFPAKRIAVTSLRKLYLRHKIKRKKVRQEKSLPGNLQAEFQSQCRELLNKLAEARQQQRTIVYCDEVNFTKLSCQSKEFSCKNTSLTVDQRDIYTGYRSVIVTMTEEAGLELSMICESAVDAETFNSFLKSLSRRFRGRPLALFMD